MYIIDKFVDNLALNTTSIITSKNKRLKNSNVTNSVRVSVYLGHHHSTADMLKHKILNLNY